jgi:uncharacterized protein
VDGPADLHNEYRKNWAGHGTHARVVRGWGVLRRHSVDTNILCTVHAVNQDYPLRVYRYFRDDLGAKYLQFIPIVERSRPEDSDLAERGWRPDSHGRRTLLYLQHGNSVTSRSVSPSAYGRFLIGVFDEWLVRDVGKVFVQDFDVMLANRFGQRSLCVHSPECGLAIVVEHNGDVYSCDHFVEPDYLLGNIAESRLAKLVRLSRQADFGRLKRTSLPDACQSCRVLWACHGGCPKDRFLDSHDGQPHLNYLCAGYSAFFNHAQPAIEKMGRLLDSGRPAADIMKRGEKDVYFRRQ